MDPFTIGMLGLGGANLIRSIASGSKAEDIAASTEAREQAREVDRAKMRDMFMNRVVSGPTPEQAEYDASKQAAQVYGAGDPLAPGRANPFSQPLGAPTGPRPAGLQEPGWQVPLSLPENFGEEEGVASLPDNWWPTDEEGNPDPLNDAEGNPLPEDFWGPSGPPHTWRYENGGWVGQDGNPVTFPGGTTP